MCTTRKKRRIELSVMRTAELTMENGKIGLFERKSLLILLPPF